MAKQSTNRLKSAKASAGSGKSSAGGGSGLIRTTGTDTAGPTATTQPPSTAK